MKRLIAVLMALLTLTLASAAAEELEDGSCLIEIPEGTIVFTPPEGLLCLTHETSASVFNRWGMSQRELTAHMDECGMQAMLFDTETWTEYQFCAYPMESTDYAGMDEVQETFLCTQFLKDFKEAGFDVSTCDVYRGTGYPFIFADAVYTFEDGYVESSLHYGTCASKIGVSLVAYPYEGPVTDRERQKMRELADSVVIEGALLQVQTEEMENGDFALGFDGRRLTFTPIDLRYCATRESGRAVFTRMGWNRQAQLEVMQRYDIYAMLTDRNQRALIQVHVTKDADDQDYSDMTDWLIEACERTGYISNGWTVKSCEAFPVDGMRFAKSLISKTGDDGTLDLRLTYATHIDGIRLEVQVFASGEKIIEMVEEQTDAFVRSIRMD